MMLIKVPGIFAFRFSALRPFEQRNKNVEAHGIELRHVWTEDIIVKKRIANELANTEEVPTFTHYTFEVFSPEIGYSLG